MISTLLSTTLWNYSFNFFGIIMSHWEWPSLVLFPFPNSGKFMWGIYRVHSVHHSAPFWNAKGDLSWQTRVQKMDEVENFGQEYEGGVGLDGSDDLVDHAFRRQNVDQPGSLRAESLEHARADCVRTDPRHVHITARLVQLCLQWLNIICPNANIFCLFFC